MCSVAFSENYISWQERVQENKIKKDKQKHQHKKINDYESSHVQIY